MTLTPTPDEKAREARIRRAAARIGLILERAKTRTEYHHDFGTYQLTNSETGQTVESSLPWGYGLSLDEVEQALSGHTDRGVDPVSK